MKLILLGLFLSTACAYGQQHHIGDDIQKTAKSSRSAQGRSGVTAQADAWFDNYRFHDGEILPRLRIHYSTLGSPHRNAHGQIDNAVLVIHWTGADGNAFLSKNYMEALFAPGRPLDATRYFLILPDNVGHGKSSKPSDGLKAAFPKYGYADMVDLQDRLVTEKLGIEHLHAMLDGVPNLQVLLPDGDAADRFIADARNQARSMDANDILYSLSSSADYDPRPGLTTIKTKVYALNFADDEFNPVELHVLEELMPKIREGRFIVQPASAKSCGHLTMAHPELWSERVAEFMESLGDKPSQSSIGRQRPRNIGPAKAEK